MSIAISGSSITFPDQTQMSTATGGSFRNLVINGDMRIWQRGTTISNPISTSFYTADRMGVNRGADVVGAVVSRIASGLAGFEYALALQRIAGDTSVQPISLYYSNESTNTYNLAGSPVTLSFYAKTGANYSGGSFAFHIYSGTGTDQRVYNYTGQVSVASANQAITSTWTKYTSTGTVPANSTELGFQILWTPTGTAGADDSIKITGVQLEQGSTATDFERRPIGVELALCQRYFYKTFPQNVAPGFNLGTPCITTAVVSGYSGHQILPINMRVKPQIVAYNPNGASGTSSTGATLVDISSDSVICLLWQTVAGDLSTNITASAEL
jgi:hypothetical protein